MRLRSIFVIAAMLGMMGAASAQTHASPNGVFLIAAPALMDPNFRNSVVLVTQVADGGSVGFIINRPGQRSLAEILPGNEVLSRFTEPLFQGGPVEGAGLFAIVRAKESPQGALRVLDDLSFALEPAVVENVLAAPPERVRFFNGYAGWAPGQLAAEVALGGWYVLNADADTVFRKDPSKLWEELVRRARAVTASLPHNDPYLAPTRLVP